MHSSVATVGKPHMQKGRSNTGSQSSPGKGWGDYTRGRLDSSGDSRPDGILSEANSSRFREVDGVRDILD